MTAGYIGGCWLKKMAARKGDTVRARGTALRTEQATVTATDHHGNEAVREAKTSGSERLYNVEHELTQLESLCIATAIGMIRDLIAQAVPATMSAPTEHRHERR